MIFKELSSPKNHIKIGLMGFHGLFKNNVEITSLSHVVRQMQDIKWAGEKDSEFYQRFLDQLIYKGIVVN